MAIADEMEKKLRNNMDIQHLEVINESYKHHGHAGDNGSGQSHYLIKVVSSDFVGLSRLQRQRLVLSILKDEISMIHALSLDLKDQ